MREIEVTRNVLASLGYASIPSSKRRKMFLKGPVPFEWLLRADRAAHTAVLALIVKMLVDASGAEPVKVPASVWDAWGLSRYQRKLAFDALERAGVIRTERAPGKAIRIWLIDKP
jgi:hypothetical protein